MDHPTAKDIVLNAWKTFSTRDAGQIASLFTPDAEWIAQPAMQRRLRSRIPTT
jgi:hypothetical protein